MWTVDALQRRLPSRQLRTDPHLVSKAQLTNTNLVRAGDPDAEIVYAVINQAKVANTRIPAAKVSSARVANADVVVAVVV